MLISLTSNTDSLQLLDCFLQFFLLLSFIDLQGELFHLCSFVLLQFFFSNELFPQHTVCRNGDALGCCSLASFSQHHHHLHICSLLPLAFLLQLLSGMLSFPILSRAARKS